MSKISAQASLDMVDQVVTEIEPIDLSRTPSESTFTRHTKVIHSIIKEIFLGIIALLQLYLTFKLSLK